MQKDMGAANKNSKFQQFCTGNTCSFILVVVIAAAIALSCVIIFTDKDLREKRQYDPSDLEWWKKTIVYQIYPRSFKDSGSDGIGDIKGITSKLDYLVYLGVGAIWISPFYKSPMRDFGYDVANYTEIDPMFGSMVDFDELVNETKKRDIKVILDFVPNHTSNESKWFIESRKMNPEYKDYYVWADGKRKGQTYEPPNNWISVFGGSAWKFDRDYRYQYYYHAFLDSQPDLNLRNPKVRKELENALKFWLDKGVAGFRVDAFKMAFEVKNISLNEDLPKLKQGEKSVFTDEQNHSYTTNLPEIYGVISDWRKMFEKYKEKDGVSRFMTTESYGLSSDMVNKYYEAGSLPFNFDLIMKVNSSCDGLCFKAIIEGALESLPSDAWPNFVMGNHDRPRVADRMGTDMIDVMNMLLLTLPGTPTCYYGDELGMGDVYYTFDETQDPYGRNYGPSGYTRFSRDPERSPMLWDTSIQAGFTTGTPWLRVHPLHSRTNVKVERYTNRNTHIKVYKKVSDIRKLPSFQNPNIQFSYTDDNFLSYIRTAEGRPKYLVILNVDAASKIGSIADFSKEPVSSTRGEVVAMTGTVDLAFGSVIDLTQIKLQRGQGLVVKVHH